VSADPTKFFTEPHYNGFPAVLVVWTQYRGGSQDPHRRGVAMSGSAEQMNGGRKRS
jgi:hypothetical protein